jgi:multimeric flavodoxin WrbA
MKVLAISGSPRAGSTTDKLVQEVLQGVECESEFVGLAGKRIGPCIACLGCVEDNVCVLEDDLQPMREKIVEADAYVIGAANYFANINALSHCFMERWYQFRHREGDAVKGKPVVLVGVGGGDAETPVEVLTRFAEYNQLDVVGSVTALGPACCFTCGYGETCKVGAIHMFFGPGTEVTEEITPRLEKQPEARGTARKLGARLSSRLARFGLGT